MSNHNPEDLGIYPFKPNLILKKLHIIPKKRLGQNFLTDKNTANRLISEAKLFRNRDEVLEIGAGLGALTFLLVQNAKKVYAIEYDIKLYNFLKEYTSNIENLDLIYGNFLKIEIPFYNKVVSNIPYTMTGPIISKFFLMEEIPEVYIIIEESLAKRIVAKPNDKNYSRLSVSVNTFVKPTIIKEVPPHCFYPVPKIKLSMIKLIPHQNIDIFLKDKNNRKLYLDLLRGIFPYKNKNISKALYLYLRIFKVGRNEIYNLLEGNQKEKKVRAFSKDDLIKIAKLIKLKKLWDKD
ncbi:MAG: ribosomal RNA small subunit methyltransferase A [Candidatus Lokiarchaeota archaeon]|nr:ribosomal RNA small subunit methyltransferase A [Candidatus Lokiarchaeota archaeon]